MSDLAETLLAHLVWVQSGGEKGTKANFFEANLSKVSLVDANLFEAYLVRANLTGANLAGAYLTRSRLFEANLTEANLFEAHLVRADLTGAYLVRANLTGADLTRADLTEVTLTGANLTGANLTGTHLAGAVFTGADLTGTCLDPTAPVPVVDAWDGLDLVTVAGEQRVYGWRTREGQHVGNTVYTPGLHVAPVFSVCASTSCHPGIYFGARAQMEASFPSATLVRCYALVGEVVHAGGKYRAKRIWVVEDFTSRWLDRYE